MSRSWSSEDSFFIWTCDKWGNFLLFWCLKKHQNCQSHQILRKALKCNIPAFSRGCSRSHLYFLAESYNAHFFAFLSGFVPAMFLVCFPCLNPFSLCVFFVFPPPSSCSLLPPALSHSPGTSLLPYCISLRFSEHHLSHCPQHAVNVSFSWQWFLYHGGQKATSTSLSSHVFEGVTVTIKPHINICLILSLKFQL